MNQFLIGIIMSIVYFIIIFYLIKMLSFAHIELTELNKKYTNQSKLLQEKEIECGKIQRTYNILFCDYTKLYTKFKKEKEGAASHLSREELDFVIKYALKQSHPDNGGNAQDFVKIKEIYNKTK